MPIRRTPLLERRNVQRKADPQSQPLPIELDVFRTIKTADGGSVQTTEKVSDLFYSERYGRKFTQDIWSVWWEFSAGIAVLLYGWNLPALPLKIELLNGHEIDIWCNLTGTFIGPGTAPQDLQWNQALRVSPGTRLLVDDLGAINTDDNAQKFIEVFCNSFASFGSVQLMLYFAQPVTAPVQYTPP